MQSESIAPLPRSVTTLSGAVRISFDGEYTGTTVPFGTEAPAYSPAQLSWDALISLGYVVAMTGPNGKLVVLEQGFISLEMTECDAAEWARRWEANVWEQLTWTQFWSQNINALHGLFKGRHCMLVRSYYEMAAAVNALMLRWETPELQAYYLQHAGDDPLPHELAEGAGLDPEAQAFRDSLKVLRRLAVKSSGVEYMADTPFVDFEWLSALLRAHGFPGLVCNRSGQYVRPQPIIDAVNYLRGTAGFMIGERGFSEVKQRCLTQYTDIVDEELGLRVDRSYGAHNPMYDAFNVHVYLWGAHQNVLARRAERARVAELERDLAHAHAEYTALREHTDNLRTIMTANIKH